MVELIVGINVIFIWRDRATRKKNNSYTQKNYAFILSRSCRRWKEASGLGKKTRIFKYRSQRIFATLPPLLLHSHTGQLTARSPKRKVTVSLLSWQLKLLKLRFHS